MLALRYEPQSHEDMLQFQFRVAKAVDFICSYIEPRTLHSTNHDQPKIILPDWAYSRKLTVSH